MPLKKPVNNSIEQSTSYTKATYRSCNWCRQNKELVLGKLFCADCQKEGIECESCHRPLPPKYYKESVKHCNTCFKKHQKGSGEVSLNGTVNTTTLQPSNNWDLLKMFNDEESAIIQHLVDELENKRGIKWFLAVKVTFNKINNHGEDVSTEAIFRNSNVATTNDDELESQIATAFQEIYKAQEEFQREGSGWNLDTIESVEINVGEYVPLMGSSYIPLPKHLINKKAIINVRNDDQRCFAWSVIAALHPATNHVDRITNYTPYFDVLNFSGIDFPTPLSQISRFENLNNISINVFGYDKEIFPLIISKKRCESHVNLLLIQHENAHHYCLIKNFSRLLGDRTQHKCAQYYCHYCLHGFSTQTLLNEHTALCSTHAPQKIKMPVDETVMFQSQHKQLKVPFVIYADFESYLEKIDENQISATIKYAKHVPSGFAYKVVSSVDKYTKPTVVYRGENVVEEFLQQIMNEKENIVDILNNVKPMTISPKEEENFSLAGDCHICNEPLGLDRVRDHDHLTGHFRGAAHNTCNLKFRF
jgi:hypothetical protein